MALARTTARANARTGTRAAARAACAGLLLSLVPAQAQTDLGLTIGDNINAQLGRNLDFLGDVDGDGRTEILASEQYNAENGTNAGAAVVLSADGVVLYSVLGDAQGDELGAGIAALGDIDGDGIPDFLAGAPQDDDHGVASGSARACSGVDGTLLLRFDGDLTSEKLGTTVAGPGDVDLDGVPDLLVGVPGGPFPRALVYSGVDGSVLFTLTGDPGSQLFGKDVAAAGDIDADGHPDLLVGMPGTARFRVFSGADGSTLQTFQMNPVSPNDRQAYAGVGDLDDDGFDDIVCGYPRDSQFFGVAGIAKAFSGADGSELWTRYGHYAWDRYGWSLDGGGDVDQDGTPDVVVGLPYVANVNAPWATFGGVDVLSGVDGHLLHRLLLPGGDGGLIGYGVAGGGDLDGDGHPDIAAGLPQAPYQTWSSGAVQRFGLRYRLGPVEPAQGLFNAWTPVTIHGWTFEPGLPVEVEVDGTPAINAVCVSPTEVTCELPPGTLGVTVDLTLTQDGVSATMREAFTYVETEVLLSTPLRGPVAGGQEITIRGTHFVDDPSTTVTFRLGTLTLPVTILSIQEPDTIVALTPPAPDDYAMDVEVSGPNGTGSLHWGHRYSDDWPDIELANVDGGVAVTLYGDFQALDPPTAIVRLSTATGFVFATVLDVQPDRVVFELPQVDQVSGLGSEILVQGFRGWTVNYAICDGCLTYTPALFAEIEGTSLGGGALRVGWRTDPTARQPQTALLWSILVPRFDPDLPVGYQLPGFSGTLFEDPVTFLGFFPEPVPVSSGTGTPSATWGGRAAGTGTGVAQAGALTPQSVPTVTPIDGGIPSVVAPMSIAIPPWPDRVEIPFAWFHPALIGLEVSLQSLVSGEGDTFGTFTNMVTLELPY